VDRLADSIGAMSKTWVWFVAMLWLSACAGTTSSTKLNDDQIRTVIAHARKLILASSAVKGPHEARIVESTEPKFRYYFMLRPFADYELHWNVGNDEAISVRGRGNVLELEGAIVERVSWAT
jgi:hypothetical protein